MKPIEAFSDGKNYFGKLSTQNRRRLFRTDTEGTSVEGVEDDGDDGDGDDDDEDDDD